MNQALKLGPKHEIIKTQWTLDVPLEIMLEKVS
jgi:hypothetical protein